MNYKQIEETLNILNKAENYGWDELTLDERKALIMNSTGILLSARENACRDLEEIERDSHD